MCIRDRARPVCWITSSKEICQEIQDESKGSLQKRVQNGLLEQMVKDQRIRNKWDRYVSFVSEENAWEGIDGMAWDDVSGKVLDKEMVQRARQEEIDEYRMHEVYTKVAISESWKETGKPPVQVRWIDINQGDSEHPDYRSRLVAKEIKTDKRDDLFAATPPLEALKLLISMAMTEGIGYEKGREETGMKLEFIDIRRAFFHAPARRKVFVQLPEEDAEEGMCGRLNKEHVWDTGRSTELGRVLRPSALRHWV